MGSHATTGLPADGFNIEDVVDDLADYVDCLMDLSQCLEHPALDFDETRHLPPEVFNASSPQALLFCRRIRDRFPVLPLFLVERLGEANSIRSNRVREAQLRIPSGKEGDVGDDITETLFSDSMPKNTDTTKSTFQSDSIFDRPMSVATFATTATTWSAIEQGRLRVPPLPKEAETDDGFLCIACAKRLTDVKNRTNWK